MKKKILIVYSSLSVGGSTTSLLSLLNEFNIDKYDIDLLVRGSGEYDHLVPKGIHRLPDFVESPETIQRKKKKSLTSWFNLVNALFRHKVMGNLNQRSQIMALDSLRFCKDLNKKYDVAISYIEGLPMYYMLSKVQAQKYISWIHLDYKGGKMNPKYDYHFLEKANKVVLVSSSCKKNFNEVFPKFQNKTVFVENILSQQFVLNRSREKINYVLPKASSRLKMVSVSRIDFSSKGLDRGVNALATLKSKGVLNDDVVWYIIGDGLDFKTLKEMIQEKELEDNVILCGAQSNPLPLVRQCDVFFLPSRSEGKPMAVTEALMLGLFVVATRYSSVEEQICDGENGLILENSDKVVLDFLEKVHHNYEWLSELKNRIKQRDYSNIEEYKKVEQLIDE